MSLNHKPIHKVLSLLNEEESADSNLVKSADTYRMGYIHHSWVHDGMNWIVPPFDLQKMLWQILQVLPDVKELLVFLVEYKIT